MIKKFLSLSGFSLLETLIALLIITVSLLGIMTLQSLTLRQIHNGYYRVLADALAQAWLERLRADPSPEGLQKESALANGLIPKLLPGGEGSYQCNSATESCTVTVVWQNRQKNELTISSLVKTQ
jgi:type IV pilus assembly protein PilV